MGNQLFLRRNEKDELVLLGTDHKYPLLYTLIFSPPETCYQYRCGWNTGVSFIHHLRTQNHTTYFCINCPASTISRLRAIVENNALLVHRDFLLDSLVAGDCLKQWQNEIRSRRDKLIDYVRVVSFHDSRLPNGLYRSESMTKISICYKRLRLSFISLQGNGSFSDKTVRTSVHNCTFSVNRT